MNTLTKNWVYVLVITVCGVFLLQKQFKGNNWNRCISADGKGYYAYLPALFIYHDLQFGFTNSYETKYYNPENKVDFLTYHNTIPINKYWLGTAVLMSPFFLVAHTIASIFNLPNDGYSFVYQVMVAIAALFYLLVSVYFIKKIITNFGLPEGVANLSAFVLVFGTNLFYYTVAEPSASHVYSLAAISAFVYFSQSYFKTWQHKQAVCAFMCFGIIILIRPSNAIVLLSLPFIAGTFTAFSKAFTSLKIWVALVLIATAFLSIQFVYYYRTINQALIYSYGNEGFNFSNPELFNYLFSYRRGVFVYAPILLFSLLGLSVLFKKSVYKSTTLFAFILVVFYIQSSWWMWYYGGAYGMRPLIDYYVFFAILLAFVFQYIGKRFWLKNSTFVVVSLLVVFNLFQTYQKVNFILPWDGVTKEIYWDIFLKTDDSYIGKYNPY